MSCEKFGYRSHGEAIAAIKGIIEDGGKSSMKSYKCKECKQFHISTVGKKHFIKTIYPTTLETKFQFQKKGQLPKQRENRYIPEQDKIISKEMAQHLKRLIEGQNQLNKQRKK